jgi:hypothetical protein
MAIRTPIDPTTVGATDTQAIINEIAAASAGDVVQLGNLSQVLLNSNVNAGTDTFTITGHGYSDDDKVAIGSADTPPAPLARHTVYFIVGSTTNTFQLSATQGGAAIDITDTGTGDHEVYTPWEIGNLPAKLALTGTLTFTNGSKDVTGSGTVFTTDAGVAPDGGNGLAAGQFIQLDADNAPVEIASITDDTNLVLVENYSGVGGSGAGKAVHSFNVQGNTVSIPWVQGLGAHLNYGLVTEWREMEIDKDLTIKGPVDGSGARACLITEHADADGWTKWTSFVPHSGTTRAKSRMENLDFDGSTWFPYSAWNPFEFVNCGGKSVQHMHCVCDSLIVYDQNDVPNRSLVQDFESDQTGSFSFGGFNLQSMSAMTLQGIDSVVDGANLFAQEQLDLLSVGQGGAGPWPVAAGEDPADFLAPGEVKGVLVKSCSFKQSNGSASFVAAAVSVGAAFGGKSTEDVEFDTCTFDWPGLGDFSPSFYVLNGASAQADSIVRDVRIHDCTFKNFDSGWGIAIFRSGDKTHQDHHLAENIFQNWADIAMNGIIMEYASNCVISRNDFTASGHPAWPSSTSMWRVPIIMFDCQYCVVYQKPQDFEGGGGANTHTFDINGYKNKVLGGPGHTIEKPAGGSNTVHGKGAEFEEGMKAKNRKAFIESLP